MKFAAFVIVLALAGCAAAPGPGSCPDCTWSTYYRFTGAGVGGASNADEVILPASALAAPRRFALKTLGDCLQPFGVTIVQPSLLDITDGEGALAWTSDTGYLSSDFVDRYNATQPPRPLRDAAYGVLFKGRIVVHSGTLLYEISAHLYRKGAADPWAAMADDQFDGAFFTRAVMLELRTRLAAAARA